MLIIRTVLGRSIRATLLVSLLALVLTLGASAEERTPIEVWLFVRDNDIVDWARAFEEKFNRENPDIEVTISLGGLRRDEIIVATAAGVGPDIYSDAMNVMGRYYASGIALPLDRYLQNSPAAPDFIPALINDLSYQGKPYGLPFYVTPSPDAYNLEMIRQAGLSEPRTWDEMVTAAKTLTRVNNNELEQLGFFTLPSGSSVAGRLLLATAQLDGHGFLGADDTQVSLNNDVGRRAMRYLYDLWQAGMAEWGTVVRSGNGVPAFIDGRIGVLNTQFNIVLQRLHTGDIPFEVGAYPLVGPTVGTEVFEYNGHALMLTPNSKHPDKAWRVMEALTDPENARGFLTARGYSLPVRGSMLSDRELLSELPLNDRLVELMQTTNLALIAAPNPYWTEVRDEIGKPLLQAVMGEIGPETALELAEPVANGILNTLTRN